MTTAYEEARKLYEESMAKSAPAARVPNDNMSDMILDASATDSMAAPMAIPVAASASRGGAGRAGKILPMLHGMQNLLEWLEKVHASLQTLDFVALICCLFG